MGACCSCCFEDSPSSSSETEMRAQASGSSSGGKEMSVSRAMSSPSIEIQANTTVSGHGLALAGVSVEQDAAYWEAHINIPGEGDPIDVMFGVATKKDRKYYKALEEQEKDAPDSNGTDLMRKIKVSNGDTIGIAVQQSDLPMIQFLLNGEPLNEQAVNRFRGTVYPSIFLPENDGLSVQLAFNENDFREITPHARFGPLIIARGLV